MMLVQTVNNIAKTDLSTFITSGFEGMPDLGLVGTLLDVFGAFMALVLMQLVTRDAEFKSMAGWMQWAERVGLVMLACFLALDAYGAYGANSRPWVTHIMIVGAVDLLLLVACLRRETGHVVNNHAPVSKNLTAAR